MYHALENTKDVFSLSAGEYSKERIYFNYGKTDQCTDINYAGLEALGNFTGYTYDVTLQLYFAQSRFYDAADHRFISEDAAQDGANWYIYCRDNPVMYADADGMYATLNGHYVSTYQDNGTTYSEIRELLLAYGAAKDSIRYERSSCRVTGDVGEWTFVFAMTGKTDSTAEFEAYAKHRTSGETKPIDTSKIQYSDGYMNIDLDYFHDFMCKQLDKHVPDPVVDDSFAGLNYYEAKVTNKLSDALSVRITRYYLDNPELQAKTTVFAFEGASHGLDKTDDEWGEYHPWGQFDATIVAVDSGRRILASTKNGSTLPDWPESPHLARTGEDLALKEEHAYTVKEGIYGLESCLHQGKYAAGKLFAYDPDSKKDYYLPSFENGKDVYGGVSGINFHAANSNVEPDNQNNRFDYSRACIVLKAEEYTRFMNAVGLVRGGLNITDYGTIKTNGSIKQEKSFSGAMVIDRSILKGKLMTKKIENYERLLLYYFGIS